MTAKTHMQKVRPGPFGGTVNGTLCNRMRVLSDGMNLTNDREQVTCAFCLRMLAAFDKRKTAAIAKAEGKS